MEQAFAPGEEGAPVDPPDQAAAHAVVQNEVGSGAGQEWRPSVDELG
jgi:hypothetical protein